MLKRLFIDQKGNVLVLVAILALVFMGIAAIVIDVGIMYSERAKLVSAVDASALSGAWELPDESKSKSSADTYLDRNVNNPTNIKTKEISIINDVNYDKVISVKALKRVELFFARIIGHSSTDINASAKAVKIFGKNRLVPIGITSSNWTNLQNNYDEYKNDDGSESITLKVISSDKDKGFNSQKGNFYGLSLGKPGGKTYEDNLGDGYSGNLSADSKIDTEPGNMVGPTDAGLEKRLKGNIGENACTIDKESKKITHKCGQDGEFCPRMAYVPIFEPPGGELKGNTEVIIKGFAQFFITDGNSSGEVRGIFLDWTMVSQATGTVNPNNVRLIE